MNNDGFIIDATELFFYLAYGVFLSYTLLCDTLFSKLFDLKFLQMIVFFIILVLLCIRFWLDYNYKFNVLYLIVAGIFSFVGIYAGNIREMVIIALFIVAAEGIDFDNILKESFIIISIFLIMTIILFFCGAFKSVDVSWSREGSDVMRYSLGFSYTTYASNYFLTVVFIWTYLMRKSETFILSYIVLLAANFFFYKMTDTRAVYYEVIFLLIITALLKLSKIDIARYKIFRILYDSSFIVLAFVSIFISYIFSDAVVWMRKLNYMLNYRLGYAHAALLRYPINLFGHKIQWVTNSTAYSKYFYVDSSYVQIILRYGIVLFVILMIGFTGLIIKTVGERNSVAIIVLIMLAVHSVTDPQLLNLAYNPFLLSLSMIIDYFYINRNKKKL